MLVEYLHPLPTLGLISEQLGHMVSTNVSVNILLFFHILQERRAVLFWATSDGKVIAAHGFLFSYDKIFVLSVNYRQNNTQQPITL